MKEDFPRTESNEDALERLEAERVNLRQRYIGLLWIAKQDTSEAKTKATQSFEKCLTATNEFINNFIQPGFDKNKDLENTKQSYLDAITQNGREFIKSRNLDMGIEQMKIVCQYIFEDKMLANRIQNLISSNEALKSMPKTSE